MNIISEYTVETITAPCKLSTISINDLDQNGMFTKNLDIKVRQIICEYLPPYKYVNGTQTQCAIFECSGSTGEGLYEGLDWLYNTLQQNKKNVSSKTKQKNCILM